MSVPPSSHNQRGQGFTIPYPAPPKGFRHRVNQVSDLRQYAHASSMAWWGAKALQGLLIGMIPFTCGFLFTAGYVLVGGSASWAVMGVLILLAGLVVILWGVLAPVTRKWIVTVPENCFWMVIDGKGFIAEYLPPGRLILPFRLNSTIHDYVEFRFIRICEVYENILRGSGRDVDLEIEVMMTFNPVEADPRLYARLRRMTRREQFEGLVTNGVRDAIGKYFTQLSPDFWQDALQSPRVLERTIIDQLLGLESMGLFLMSSQSVVVLVHGMTLSSRPMPSRPAQSRRDPFSPSPYDPRQPRTSSGFGSARGGHPGVHRRDRGNGDHEGYRTDRERDRWDDVYPPRDAADPLPDQEFNQPLPEDALGETQHHIPAFIPGTVEIDMGDEETDLGALLKEIQDSEPPKVERRAKLSDGTQPKTARPEFWIKRRRDDEE